MAVDFQPNTEFALADTFPDQAKFLESIEQYITDEGTNPDLDNTYKEAHAALIQALSASEPEKSHYLGKFEEYKKELERATSKSAWSEQK